MLRRGGPAYLAVIRTAGVSLKEIDHMSAPFVDLSVHHAPKGAVRPHRLGFTKVLRFCADTFFAKRYGHRAVVLETVAAVPGMVGATINHLTCLRRMCDDKGWIKTLMDEAENERMHLMTFIEVVEADGVRAAVIIGVQWVFYLCLLRPLPRSARRPRTASSAISRRKR